MKEYKRDLSEILAYSGLRQLQPSIRLRPFIQCYWQIKSTLPMASPSTELLHPDGGLGMILNFGDALAYEDKAISSDCFMDGIHTKTRWFTMAGHIDAIGIRFNPGGASHFFSVPLAEINNSTLNLSELALDQLTESCQEEKETNPSGDILGFVDGLLLGMLTEPRRADLAAHALMKKIRASEGRVLISNMTEDAGKSYRQLERLFKRYVGMTPKKYARIVRVRNARYQLKNKSTQSCTEIGALSGFYDQAHFIREFQSIIGLSPMGYLNFKRH
jgi:AraC-like DNA-binding protein